VPDIFHPLTKGEWLTGINESGRSGGIATHSNMIGYDVNERSSNSTTNSTDRGQNRKTEAPKEVLRRFNFQERPEELEASFLCFHHKHNRKKYHYWELFLYCLMMNNRIMSEAYGKYPKKLSRLKRHLSEEQIQDLDSIDPTNIVEELKQFFRNNNI
jgi:hypothetical protein